MDMESGNNEKRERFIDMINELVERMFPDGFPQLNIDEQETEEGLDQIPEGVGEFGLMATNPVPVRGLPANELYLARLRTADNKPIRWRRLGSTRAENIEYMIDIYEITDMQGCKISNIYICPYCEKMSTLAPKGFIIL